MSAISSNERAVLAVAREAAGRFSFDFKSLAEATGLSVGDAVAALSTLDRQRVFELSLPWLVVNEAALDELMTGSQE